MPESGKLSPEAVDLDRQDACTMAKKLRDLHRRYELLSGHLTNQLAKSSHALEHMIDNHGGKLEQMNNHYALITHPDDDNSVKVRRLFRAACAERKESLGALFDRYQRKEQTEREYLSQQLMTLQQINDNQKMLINSMRVGIRNLVYTSLDKTEQFISYINRTLFDYSDLLSEFTLKNASEESQGFTESSDFHNLDMSTAEQAVLVPPPTSSIGAVYSEPTKADMTEKAVQTESEFAESQEEEREVLPPEDERMLAFGNEIEIELEAEFGENEDSATDEVEDAMGIEDINEPMSVDIAEHIEQQPERIGDTWNNNIVVLDDEDDVFLQR